MTKFTLLITLFISILFFGCSTTLTLNKQIAIADQAISTGDYETALASYTKLINDQQSKDKEISGSIYSSAAKAAFRLNKITEAEMYFKQAYYKGYADAEMYSNMISIYKSIDNLSKEIDALEYFVKNFKADDRFTNFNQRLLETYIESENWEKAVALWPSLDTKNQMDVHNMELYLTALKNLNNESKSDMVANAILKLNVTSQPALEWMAEKFFMRAENRYQKEMTAYEKNKTNKQYKIMLKALDVVTSNFKKSLKYYQKLYKLYPSKEYAKFMANIYIRFQDKAKSEYYLKLSK